MEIREAPFTEEEVESLNGYQESGYGHPFTCGNNSDHILVATREGWVCPECDYTQRWAHKFMTDNSWKTFVCDRCQHWDCCCGCIDKI